MLLNRKLAIHNYLYNVQPTAGLVPDKVKSATVLFTTILATERVSSKGTVDVPIFVFTLIPSVKSYNPPIIPAINNGLA